MSLIIKIILKALSVLYFTVMEIRSLYYDFFSPKAQSFPVISVGGIRVGGSGKTPLTDFVISKIEEAGFTPVLFSRGYKRKSNRTQIVSPESKTTWEEVGDEALMLKTHHKNLWLAIDAKRKRAEKKLRAFGLKNIVGVMDDGFQHRQFARNLDIVILSPNDLNDKMLPYGRLRESAKSLKRADLIVSQEKIESHKNCLVSFAAGEFINAISGEKKTSFDEEILCFCGIARPQRFVDSVKELTKKDFECLFFPDHHRYCDKDYKKLNSAPQAVLVTTEKDFMRLDTKKTEKMQNLWYLSYGVKVEAENDGLITNKILGVCGEKNG